MKLLQVPTAELEQRIKEELEVNPALEEGEDYDNLSANEAEGENEWEEDLRTEAEKEFDFSEYMDDDDTPAYKMAVSNKGPDDEEKEVPFAASATFRDQLIQQLGLRNITEKEELLARMIIGNLDDDGYLRRDLASIADDLAFSHGVQATEKELEDALHTLQQLDPAGVGARSLQECLLLQIKRKDASYPSVRIATDVLENHFDSFTKKHYDRITRRLGISDEDLSVAISEIVRLNPKPGNSASDSQKSPEHIVPDFLLSVEDEQLKLSLNARNAPELKVSEGYKEMMRAYAEASKHDKKQKEAVLFVKQKIDAAKWFIDAIKQRQHTLMLTMNAIMEFQREYFLTGDETKLRPMILKDIAEIVHLDISTVSRVANSKYVQTPYGTFLLKSFFSESLSTESGEEVSTREVKKILQDAIDAEDKREPLTDERLMELLKDRGYNIARRTVAKYREQLNIPVARLRKEI
jgi:RNA polymerase sigma-54 factor